MQIVYFIIFPVYIKRCIFALAVCWMTVKASGAIFPVTTGTPCLMIPAFVQRFLQLYLQVFRYDQVQSLLFPSALVQLHW